MTNPLLIQGDFPRFDEISATHVVPAITEILASNRDALDRIKGLPEASMTVDLLLELEALDARLNDAWNPVEHLNAVVNSEALREAYNEARKLITDYQTELGQDEALFWRLSAPASQRARPGSHPGSKKKCGKRGKGV